MKPGFGWLAFGVGCGPFPMVSKTFLGGLSLVAVGTCGARCHMAGDASCIGIQGYVVGMS